MHFGNSLAGNQSKFLRSLPKTLCTLSKILRTLSKILRTLSKKIVPYPKNYVPFPKKLRIPPHTQVGLQLCLANMFKAMKASCRELQAQLEQYTQQVSRSSSRKKDREGALTVHGLAYTACLIMHLGSK